MPENLNQFSCPSCSRRRFLRVGVGAAGMTAAAMWLPGLASAAPPNFTFEPVPIPELDMNGSHNDAPGPGSEPAETYNFNGQVARCRVAGTGKDSKGNAIPFGSKGTDFGFVSGNFIAADGSQHTGAFAHI